MLILLLGGALELCAQVEEAEETEIQPESAPVVTVEEVAPPVFYLRDKDGNLVYVPDFSFERYEELVALEIQGRAAQPPDYHFADVIQVSARIVGDVADVEAQFPVRIIPFEGETSDRWIRMPLRLNGSILTEPVSSTAEGQLVITYAPEEDGYVAWWKGTGEADLRLTVRAKVPVIFEGGNHRLRLTLPRSSTRLRVTVPSESIEAETGDPDEAILTVARSSGGETELLVDSTGGTTEVAWHERQERAGVLEASGSFAWTIDASRVECDAQLSVRNRGAAIDSFVVVLPPDMELISFEQPGYRFTPLDATAGRQRQRKRIHVQRLDGKTSGTLDVRLLAWRPTETDISGESLELGGFAVEDALRQWGMVDVAVIGDWRVDWQAGPQVQRIAPSADAVPEADVLARFKYLRQPFSLKVQLQTPPANAEIEPAYLFQISRDRIQLNARLRCPNRMVRSQQIAMDLQGWQVDSVTPPNATVADADDAESGPLRLSLPLGGTTSEPPEVLIRAHRSRDPEDTLLTLVAPRLIDAQASPALLVITADQDLDLRPDPERMRGLTIADPPDWLTLDGGATGTLVYREEPDLEGAVFLATVRSRARSSVAEVHGRMAVNAEKISLEQELVLSVAYEPLETVTLEVPPEILTSGRFEVMEESGAVLPSVPASEEAKWRTENRVPVAVPLPEPVIGKHVLKIRYEIPMGSLEAGAMEPMQVPLVQPMENESTSVTRNTLEIVSEEGLAVELDDDQWSLESTDDAASSTTSDRAGPVFATEGWHDLVSLTITAIPPSSDPHIIVLKAWLQTWLAGSNRRDRACLRVQTDSRKLQIRLPAYAQTEDIRVLVDGRPATNLSVFRRGIVHLELGAVAEERELTIELFFWSIVRDPLIGRLTVEMPQVVGAERAQWSYWELAVPDQEFLVWRTGDLISELNWRWNDIGWRRSANLTTAELEIWAGASHQPALPAAVHRYLFSSTGTFQPCTFVTVKRPILVLIASGLVLVVGLLLLYVPRLRHPASLLVGGVAVISTGLIYPDVSVMAAQAATFGLGLLVISRLIDWLVGRRQMRQAVVRGAVYSADAITGEATRAPDGSSSRRGSGTMVHAGTIEP